MELPMSRQTLPSVDDLVEACDDPVLLTIDEGTALAASPALRALLGFDGSIPRDADVVVGALAGLCRSPDSARERLSAVSTSEDMVLDLAAGGTMLVSARAVGAQRPTSLLWRFSVRQDPSRIIDGRMADFAEASDDFVVAIDRDWYITYLNPAAERMLSSDRSGLEERVRRETVWEIWPEYLGTEVEKNYRKAMTDRVFVSFMMTFSGRRIHATFYPAHGGVLSWTRDVTEELSLDDIADDRARSMLAYGPQTLRIAVVSLDGTYADANQAYCELLGRERDELLGESILHTVHPDDVSKSAEDMGRMVDGVVRRNTSRLRLLTARGPRWVDAEAVLQEGEGGERFIVGHIRDVHDEVQVIELLEKNEAQLQRQIQRERAISERLRQLDEMKDVFLTSVSHDLRTPLAAVMGLAGTLHDRRDELDRETRDEVTERLWRNAERLQTLLSDLLDLDRLQRGILEPTMRPTDLSKIVHLCVQHLDASTDHPLHLRVDPVEAEIDPAMFERVAENLLNNAVKHTPSGSNIWVSLKKSGSSVVLMIEDDGPGIPDGSKEMIFEAFRQGPGARGPTPGVGIGLSLVARFVALHQGTVHVEDRPGRGARFTVVIPRSRADQPLVKGT